jgi:glyoxylase-like metal-dependent hydrolase (beta-lactamase superfamily II)
MSHTHLNIESFFDPATFTFSHIVWDSSTSQCALIDSVLDYDPKSGRTSTKSADILVNRVKDLSLKVEWILETHVHADHLSAAPYLQNKLGGKLAIGSHITKVQNVFGKLFNAGTEFARDGSQFDQLLSDQETFKIGSLEVKAMHTPGHTPACMTYVVTDTSSAAPRQVAFVGDTLFMPDYGTARCDFPGGSAATLFSSIQKVLSLPDSTELYMCHDYPPEGRAPQFVSTVAEQKQLNIHVHQGVQEQDFIQMRQKRDATLSMPVLILPSVQINMRAGQLPPPEDNGQRYLKIPLDAL